MAPRIAPNDSNSTNEGEEADIVYNFYCNFEKAIMQKEELKEKVEHYFKGDLTSKAAFAEIYNADDVLRIKTETSIEQFVFSKEIINKAENINGVIKHKFAYSIPNTFYQTINFNTLSASLVNSTVFDKLSSLIEVKMNRELFKIDDYYDYLLNKYDVQLTPVLVPEERIRYSSLFFYDEIDIEFSSVNNYLFHQLSNFLTVMSIRDSEIVIVKANIVSLPCLINLIDNCKLLDVVNYFCDLYSTQLKLGDYKELLFKHNPVNSIERSMPLMNSIRNGTSSASADTTKQMLQEKVFESIKNELLIKEQYLTKMIIDNPSHYDSYTRFYIKDQTMSEAEVKQIGTWLIHSKAKLFAWHLNPEDTKKIGLKASKIGIIPRLNNLYLYLKLN